MVWTACASLDKQCQFAAVMAPTCRAQNHFLSKSDKVSSMHEDVSLIYPSKANPEIM